MAVTSVVIVFSLLNGQGTDKRSCWYLLKIPGRSRLNVMKSAIYSGFRNYLNFKGKATRPEFWLFYLFIYVASILGTVIDGVLGVESFVFTGLLLIAFYIPVLSASIRRTHDAGKCGWFILVPIVNLYLLVQPSHSEPTTTPGI